MENDILSDSDASAGAAKLHAQDSINEAKPLFDSSTPLLGGLPIEGDTDPEAQQKSTGVSEETSPPMTWREWGCVLFTVIAILASPAVPAFFEASGLDPLYFAKLAWYSISVSMALAWTLVRGSQSGSVSVRGEAT